MTLVYTCPSFHSVLLVALDQGDTATTLPNLVSQFNTLSDVSWVAGAYFLTEVSWFFRSS